MRNALLPEDAALLSWLRLGSRAAVDALLDRYHEEVHGFAMFLLKDERDAEDAVREVFLAVVKKANGFRGNAVPSSWIYRICVNACVMRLRKGRRTEAVPIEAFLPAFNEEGAHADPVVDWSRDIERRLPREEAGKAIGGFAGELPEKYLVVFALCDARGFSCEETAQILGMAIAEVKSRLHGARLCLRERIGRYLQEGRTA